MHIPIKLIVKFVYCSSLFKLEKCAEVKYLNIMSTSKSVNTYGNDFGNRYRYFSLHGITPT